MAITSMYEHLLGKKVELNNDRNQIVSVLGYDGFLGWLFVQPAACNEHPCWVPLTKIHLIEIHPTAPATPVEIPLP